jgi:hypothetical protein
LGQEKTSTFAQVSNIDKYDDDYVDEAGYVVAVYVRLDKSYTINSRSVDDILTLIAAIGGL